MWGATRRVFPFLVQKKKRPEEPRKNARFVGQGRYKKTKKINAKNKAKNLSWLGNFFLGGEGYSEYFDLGILFIFVPDVLPLSFFFLEKIPPWKKNAKKLCWLTNNFSWRFLWFFWKVTLKKKNDQEEPRSPKTGNLKAHSVLRAPFFMKQFIFLLGLVSSFDWGSANSEQRVSSHLKPLTDKRMWNFLAMMKCTMCLKKIRSSSDISKRVLRMIHQ